MSTIDVTTDPTDPELITRVREGDVAAYGSLFSRHIDAANRLARHLVSSPDADDLVSEAFVKVLNVMLDGGGPDVAFRAYLLTAVRRLHVDKVRSTQRATPTDDLTPYDRGVPFIDTAVAGFEGGAAAKAFASLPERWQLVLWHLEVENQKPAEIAPLLGMSANSVSALAYRAREGLRQAFLTMHTSELADDDCLETHGLLGSYVRRGLARRDTARVENHLHQCRRCTSTWLELEEVNSSLSALLGPAVLGGVSAAYLGGGSVAALGGTGGWAGLIQLLDRSKDVVLASPATSMATASVVSMTTATAVVVGVQAAPLALPSLHSARPLAAAAAGTPYGEGDTGFSGLDKMRAAISLGAELPIIGEPTPTATPSPVAEAVLPVPDDTLLPEEPAVPVTDPGSETDTPSDPEPTDAPSDTPTDPPADTPTDAPADPPADTPTTTPVDPPAETPVDPPADTPVDPPTDPPADPPSDRPTDTPDNQNQGQEPAVRVAPDPSDGAPDTATPDAATPVVASTPEETPEATPDTTPEATPEATPETTPPAEPPADTDTPAATPDEGSDQGGADQDATSSDV